jgi:hypothetical protein
MFKTTLSPHENRRSHCQINHVCQQLSVHQKISKPYKISYIKNIKLHDVTQTQVFLKNSEHQLVELVIDVKE